MAEVVQVRGLAPEPAEEWRRLLRFVGWTEADRTAALSSVEPLLRQAPTMVAQTYEHLARVPETAAILGWEGEVNPAELEERRRFFTVWIARTLGTDTSDEFARYLFRGGKLHAGHGLRQTHVPPEYVTAAMGLMQGTFARCLGEAGVPAAALGAATVAWSKYMSVQLDLMLLGYRVARAFDEGSICVPCHIYGRMRPLIGRHDVTIRLHEGGTVEEWLRKFFDYYPEARPVVLNEVWESHDDERSGWRDVAIAYEPHPGWRVLLNGRDVAYVEGGSSHGVRTGDELSLFPPGR